jgi:hypothetical protein
VITLQLADVPFDADVANPQGRPLGTRAQVASRFIELLPGTAFDESGRGVFSRGSYQVAFMMYGDPPTSIGVAFNEPEAFTPLARVVEKTGWCLIDPEQKGFVDLAASRGAGRVVLVGEAVPAAAESAAVAESATASAKPSVWKPAGERKRSRVLLAATAGVIIAATGYVAAWRMTNGQVSKLPALIVATQSSITRFEKYPDRMVRRKELMETLPAPYKTDRIVEQLVDAQMASRAYHSFVDGRFTSPELLSNEQIWSRFQMPSFLPGSFAQRQRDGYDFEFAGMQCEESEPGWPECRDFAYIARPLKAAEGTGVVFALFSVDDKIRVRTDGKVPTRDDRAIDAAPGTP